MDRKSEKIWEMKLEKEYEQQDETGRCICPSCNKPVCATEGELAHLIPQSKWALAKWGPAVIHHPLNMALTHRGACNDKQSISNHPLKMEALAEHIQEAMNYASDTD